MTTIFSESNIPTENGQLKAPFHQQISIKLEKIALKEEYLEEIEVFENPQSNQFFNNELEKDEEILKTKNEIYQHKLTGESESCLKHGWIFKDLIQNGLKGFQKKKIGQYCELEIIYYEKYNKPLAIKEIPWKSDLIKYRIQNEIHVLEEIFYTSNKPNFFPDYHGYAFNEIDNNYCLFFDYYPFSLDRQIKSNKENNRLMDFQILTSYFASLVDGLSFLQTMGICHCNLKPENVYFDELKQLKIVDFGSSQRIIYEKENKVDEFKGSLYYQSPEWIEKAFDRNENNNKIDVVKSDVFVLGLIMLEMANCYHPKDYTGQKGNFLKIIDDGLKKFKENYQKFEIAENTKFNQTKKETLKLNPLSFHIVNKEDKISSINCLQQTFNPNTEREQLFNKNKVDFRTQNHVVAEIKFQNNIFNNFQKFCEILQECLTENPIDRPNFLDLKQKCFSSHIDSPIDLKNIKENIFMKEFEGSVKEQQGKAILELQISPKMQMISRIKSNSSLIFANLIALITTTISFSLKLDLYLNKLGENSVNFKEKHNLVFNSLESLIFAFDPLLLLIFFINLILLFFRKMEKSTLFRRILIILIFIYLARIALGIIFFAGNNHAIKKTLDSYGSKVNLNYSEKIFYDSLYANWIYEIIFMISSFITSGYLCYKLIKVYLKVNEFLSFNCFCFLLLFVCLMSILSISFKTEWWDLLENANYYIENHPNVYRSLQGMIAIDIIFCCFMIIMLLYHIIHKRTFVFEIRNKFIVLMFAMHCIMKFILGMLIIVGDDYYCKKTIDYLKNNQQETSLYQSLLLNWIFEIVETSCFGLIILILAINFRSHCCKFIILRNDKKYNAFVIFCFVSLFLIVLSISFNSNFLSKINDLNSFSNVNPTVYHSTIRIIIIDVIFFILILIFLISVLFSNVNHEKLFPFSAFSFIIYSVLKVILGVLFLKGDHNYCKNVLDDWNLNIASEAFYSSLKLNWNYEFAQVIFFGMALLIIFILLFLKFLFICGKFYVFQNDDDGITYLLKWVCTLVLIVLSLAFNANFLSNINDTNSFSNDNPTVYHSVKGILFTDIISLVCFLVFVIFLLFSDEDPENLYCFTSIFIFLFWIVKIALGVLFLKGDNNYCKNALDNWNLNIESEAFYSALKLNWNYEIFLVIMFGIVLCCHSLGMFYHTFDEIRNISLTYHPYFQSYCLISNLFLTIISLALKTDFWEKIQNTTIGFLLQIYPTTFHSLEGIIVVDVILLVIMSTVFVCLFFDYFEENEKKYVIVCIYIFLYIFTIIRCILGIIFMCSDNYYVKRWVESDHPESYGRVSWQYSIKMNWEFEIFDLVFFSIHGVCSLAIEIWRKIRN